jgi:SAM-dependent methyltransferase
VARIYPYPGTDNPDAYEWENRIADPERRIEAFMGSVRTLEGSTVVDIGSGSAFHAWQFAAEAATVYAVEPSPLMLAQALRRPSRANLHLVRGEAEHVPLRAGFADVVHARFAYFFGPEPGRAPEREYPTPVPLASGEEPARVTSGVSSCEPGIREALRLMNAGGAFFVVDNHLTSGDFAGLLYRYGYVRDPSAEQSVRDRFWRHHGFDRETIASCWRAPDRATLRQVMAMEFPGNEDAILSKIAGAELSYHYDVYWRRA